MPKYDKEAAVAEFIRTRGVTRCPTACVLPTQGLVDVADRAALEEYAVARDRCRQTRAAARWRPHGWGTNSGVQAEVSVSMGQTTTGSRLCQGGFL